MSRDGYERWEDRPDPADPDAYDPRDGRRSRRAASPDEQWPPDAQAPDPRRGRGSHRRSGEYPAAESPGSGYGEPGYAEPGYAEPGYAEPGYTDPGYAGADYGEAGHRRPDYAPPAYPDAGYAGSAHSGPGYGEAGYRDPGYSDAGNADPGYSGPHQAGGGQPDGYGRSDGYGQPVGYGRAAGYPDGGYSGAGYANSGEYGTAGPGGADRQDRYREAPYPADGYPGGSSGPSSGGHPAQPDLFAPRTPFPSVDPYVAPEPYGAPDPYSSGPDNSDADTLGSGSRPSGPYRGPDGYGGRASYGGQDSYDGPAGYDSGDPYAGRDSRGRPGPGQAGYEQSGAQFGGGYDEHGYGAAAGPDQREQYPAQGPDYGRGADRDAHYGWQDPVDDSGVTRRRQRDPEDELDADSARHNGFFRGFGASDDEVGHRPPRRKRSKAGITALLILIIFAGGLVGGGAYAYHWYTKRHADWAGSQGYGSVVVRVAPGAVACSSTMENTLVRDGVVASASAFCSAAKADGGGAALEPGTFRLRKHMGAALAWALIINPKSRVQTTVGVPDGLRASKIIALLAKKTGIPYSKFESALKDTSALGLPSWAKGNPEGFLWPATYPFQPDTSALSILRTMVKQANTEFASLNLAAKAKAAQFTEYQVIISASLLEGEVPPQYYTKVARVIDNRLNQTPPMDLGLDSTVAFAVNKYIYNLSQSDLNVNSPYNTTNHAGLPPGPINSPDAAAIKAVLHPAEGTWLYFVTVNKQGLTLFTSDPSQFTIWSNEAKKNGV